MKIYVSTCSNLLHIYIYSTLSSLDYTLFFLFLLATQTDKTASVIESFFGMLEMPRPKFMANMGGQLTMTLKKHGKEKKNFLV